MPSAGNVPGGRDGAASWADTSGNIWIFGGDGFDCDFDGGSSAIELNDLWKYNPTSGEWTWMGGPSKVYCGPPEGCAQTGVYGTLGAPSAANIPGSRLDGVSWTDNEGNLWLFGGAGVDSVSHDSGTLNDLWEFDPSANEWTWMSGSSTLPANCGTCGQPGVYGILGVPAAGNVPGGRFRATGWTDSTGNLWLFGGAGYDAAGSWGNLNDLWRFNPATTEWIWMGGSSTITYNGPQGVYGMLGTPAAGNVPGGLSGAAGWVDTRGNLWLFGGGGYEAADTSANFGDSDALWEFIPATSEWAWMGGSNTANSPGVYGVGVGLVPSPGSRYGASTMTDSSGNAWLLGGLGYDVTGVLGGLNDLWKIDFVLPPAFTLGASPTSLSASSGGQASTTLTVTPQNGFNSAVSFACSGLAAGATCKFDPATVTPTASGAAVTTKLTISAETLSANTRRNSRPFLPQTALALTLCFFCLKKRHNLQLFLLSAMAFASFSLLAGCGGGSGGSGDRGGVTPVTSTITVTATSGSVQQTATISLTVN